MSKKVATKITTPDGHEISFESSVDASEYLGVRPARLDDWRRKHPGRKKYSIKVNYIIEFEEGDSDSNKN